MLRSSEWFFMIIRIKWIKISFNLVVYCVSKTWFYWYAAQPKRNSAESSISNDSSF